ncbi:MAG: hypothetical protein WBF93_02010 [Pirellulales bacterium]
MAINDFALLADAEDWLRLIVPAVFVIIWVISQIASLGGGNKNAGPRHLPQQPKAGLAREIESFLNQVKKGQAADGGGPKPVAAQPQAPRQQPNRPRREPLQPQRAHKPLRPARAEVVEAELVEPQLARRGTTKETLRQRGARRDKQRQEPKPSARDAVDQADERMTERLHQAFDRDLGELVDTSDDGRNKDMSSDQVDMPAIPTTAEAVRDMLASPESIRTAVILSEILRRPGPL